MKTRIITAVVSALVFIGALFAPPVVFQIGMAIVALAMLYECYSSAKTPKSVRAAGFVSGAAILAAAYESIYFEAPIWENTYLIIAIIFTVLLHMAAVVLEHGKTDYKTVLSSGFLTIYITLSISCILNLRAETDTAVMLIIFICAWMTDTGAYFCGSAFGKRKLTPNISPKKTVEGSIGGVLTAILSCIIYLVVYTKVMDGTLHQWPIIVIGGAVVGGVSSVFSQLGDLVASAIKRDIDVKDFGTIFPGHGGFMDRFDSVIYIAPIMYILLQFLIG